MKEFFLAHQKQLILAGLITVLVGLSGGMIIGAQQNHNPKDPIPGGTNEFGSVNGETSRQSELPWLPQPTFSPPHWPVESSEEGRTARSTRYPRKPKTPQPTRETETPEPEPTTSKPEPTPTATHAGGTRPPTENEENK